MIHNHYDILGHKLALFLTLWYELRMQVIVLGSLGLNVNVIFFSI